MNQMDVRAMREQMRRLQDEINQADNSSAHILLTEMARTGREYTATEMSEITEGMLTPSQTVAVVRAVDSADYSPAPRKRNNRPRTKFIAASDFRDFGSRRSTKRVSSFTIRCDANGNPLAGAVPSERVREQGVYQLTKRY